MLHGFTDNENSWLNNGWVDNAMDQGIMANEIDEMILIMPDGGLNWYVNLPNKKNNYEEMFIQEFIPFIEAKYKVKNNRKNRFIGGLSMGGYGALGYSMRHTAMFSACIALSSAVKSDKNVISMPQEKFNFLYHAVYGTDIKGMDRISTHWKANNPIFLAEKMLDNELKSVKWYLSCGDKDFLLEGNLKLHEIFSKKNILHELRIKEGAHNWTYWRSEIKEGLKFLSKTK